MKRPTSLETMTRQFVIKKARDNDRKYDVFHPSAWGICLRKVAYQHYNYLDNFMKKADLGVDLRGERIYDNGNGAHSRWQRCLAGSGVLRGAWKCPNPLCNQVHGEEERLGIFNPLQARPGWRCPCGNDKLLDYEEVRVTSDPRYNFDGHVDAIIDVRNTEYKTGDDDLDLFVMDFKTMKSDQFVSLAKPKDEHVVQVNIYMWLLDLKSSVLAYENKDDQSLKEIYVPRDDELIDKIKRQSEWLVEALRRRKVPMRPDGSSMSRPPCRFCEFVGLCYA